ncbi:hypothetical protein EV363DRAFT_1585719 [Boletus edulis]|nr:hypothetical protein EV363DRAFT_1585719 [Boletus edulis]
MGRPQFGPPFRRKFLSLPSFTAVTRSQQRLLPQLTTSNNELASGLGQCLEAPRLISALPRASPVFVKYTSAPSPTTKAFGRDHLSRPSPRTSITVIPLIEASLSLPDPIKVTTALFIREDGTVDPTPVLDDEDSWKELAPYGREHLSRYSPRTSTIHHLSLDNQPTNPRSPPTPPFSLSDPSTSPPPSFTAKTARSTQRPCSSTKTRRRNSHRTYTLHVEADVKRPPTALSSYSTTLAGTVVSGVTG